MTPRSLAGRRRSHDRSRKAPRFRPDSLPLEERSLLAITVDIRYDFDASNFFNTQQKRDLLQQAANTIAATLNDSLAAIVPSGVNSWSAQFENPATGLLTTVPNLVVPANTIILYVGARDLTGTEAGFAGPGGFQASGTTDWLDLVQARGQAGALLATPTDTGPWGGNVTFDSVGTNWFFGATTAGLGSNQVDFLSIATHEIGHVLGIGNVLVGQASSWSRWLVGNTFVGPASEAAHGGQPVPTDPGGHHWAQGVTSGGAEAAMTPILTQGTRKLFTPLDYAGLQDAGWQVTFTPPDVSTVQMAVSATAVSSTAAVLNVPVIRAGGLTNAASVQVSAVAGTAVAGVDYFLNTTNLSFAAGVTSQSITVTILPHLQATTDLNFTLVLGSPSSGAQVGTPATTLVTILHPQARVPQTLPDDFDGDRKSDLSVYRPSTAQWLLMQSTAGPRLQAFGAANTDIPLQGDFDGDGKADFAVFRPSTAQWLILQSTAGGRVVSFGAANLDIPVPADYDGDGKTDIAVFRPTTGEWFLLQSTSGARYQPFGGSGDQPVPGDYDGDGRADLAVFRPTTAQWLIMQSTAGPRGVSFGAPLLDKPIPADYDGDGRTDPAVFRPTTAEWLLLQSTAGPKGQPFGAANLDIPVPQDYDGDGRADLAVFRPSTAQWLILQSTAGPRGAFFGGGNLDVPLTAPISYRFNGALATLPRSSGGSPDLVAPPPIAVDDVTLFHPPRRWPVRKR